MIAPYEDTHPHFHALSNGLRVVALAQPALHRAHIALYVRVGSRFETPESNGLSHFLEHMLYRGTSKLPTAHDVNLAFEKLGGYLYAATQADYGVFSLTLPSESLDEACLLFGDVIAAPKFNDIAIERGIVCEEILEDLDDEGRQINADNLSRALIYPTHPLGYTITGTEEHIRSFEKTHLLKHHARHYTAASSVLAFGGAIEPERAFRLAEEAFGKLPRGKAVSSSTPVHTQKKPRLKILENLSSQTELRICFRAIAEHAPQRIPLDVLLRVIDDGMSTRLYHRICNTQGLCYDVSAGYDGYEDDGVIDFAAGVQHARSSVVAREILDLVTELATHGPTEDELIKAKRRHHWELSAMTDSAEDLAGYYGTGILFNHVESPAERQSRFDRVTREEVQEIARFIARPERLNVVAVGLLENDEDHRLTEVVKGWKGGP